MQIPKRIFYVWFGDDMPADVHACIQTWKLAMPDYKIIRIGQEKSEWFDFQDALQKCQWLKAVYDRQLWAYVSDYVRIKVLYDHGGIYLDTDITAMKNFEPLRNSSLFLGFQSSGKVNGAVIGCIKNNPFLKSMLDYYEKGHVFKEPHYLIPEIMTYLLEKDYGLMPFDSRENPKVTQLDDIVIYPEKFFYPFRYSEKYTDDCITSDTYAVHWWKASWRSEEDIYWLQKGRLYFLDENQFDSDESTADRLSRQKTRQSFPTWIYHVKRRRYGTKYYVLGIPFIVVRRPEHYKCVYLFNIIPLYGK